MTKDSNPKGKQNLKKEIEELEEKISQLDEGLDKKLVEFTNLQEKRDALSSDECQEEFKKIKGEIEELRMKMAEIRDRKEYLEELLELQEIVKKGISKVLPYLPMIKGLFTENKGILIDFSEMFLDFVCDLVDGLDKPLDRLFKLSANQLFKRFNSLKDAGFDEPQALALLIASNAQAVDILNRFASLVDKIPSKSS